MTEIRTIVVTGTASGLGRAAVERFADAGWNVVATVRKQADVQTFASRPNVATLLLDVTDQAAVSAFGQQAVQQFGQVDVLVNNAGYYQMGPLEATSMDQIRTQFETNVFGLIAVTQAFIPTMRERRSGMIINISSISAENGYPFTSVYGASKAAVATLTDSLNVELAPFGVVSKAIFPGTHATSIFKKVDFVATLPDEYRPLLEKFVADQSSVMGSAPTVVADVIMRAVTDGKDDKTRYFAGPDATSIPVSKRLLGPDRYFGVVKRAILEGPGPITRRLARSGNTPVEIDFSKILGAADSPNSTKS